jgi:hypothetical protein
MKIAVIIETVKYKKVHKRNKDAINYTKYYPKPHLIV